MDDALQRKSAGRLTGLERGILSGEITLDPALSALSELTIEVFAHGILAASAKVRMTAGQDGVLPFSVPLGKFPQVTLPCTLAARVAETDTIFDSGVELKGFEDLWRGVMAFSARIEKVSYNRILVRATGAGRAAADHVFELRDWGDLVAISEFENAMADGSAIYALEVPDRLLDGTEHRLSVIHRGSGLPLTAHPLHMRLDMRADPQPVLRDVIERLADVERQLRERYADAFNGLATELYRHIDVVTQNQRSNFEREIAAMRKLLSLPEREEVETIAAAMTLPFDGPVSGYGVHRTETTSTGKAYRFVAPISGVLLPALRATAPKLRIQGIRRHHDGALDGAKVLLNGTALKILPYVNKASESWNITADVPADLLRRDRNILELRLPNAVPDSARSNGRGDHAVGIMFVSLGDVAGGAGS